MSSRFPIRRSPWALPFLVPLAPGRPSADVGEETIVVRMGLLGRADVPVRLIAAVGTMDWPWWYGVGVRIARGLVAFVGASGPMAVLELSEPVQVRAPLRWRAERVAIGVEDIDGFVAAVARVRRGG